MVVIIDNMYNVYFNFLVNFDEIVVIWLFIYFKNIFDIDNLEDYLLERNLFSGVDDEYVLSKLEIYYRCERFIK